MLPSSVSSDSNIRGFFLRAIFFTFSSVCCSAAPFLSFSL